MTTTWCWEKISGLFGCCTTRENPHDNRPGILGPVNVETIRIYRRNEGNPAEREPPIDEEDAEDVRFQDSDAERGSAECPVAGPSRATIISEEDPDAIHEVVEGGDADAEVVVDRRVEEVEVTEEAPKLSKYGRLKALFSRGIIHRLRRLSDEAMHNLNIPENVQQNRRRIRISQIRAWREHEWALSTCCTGGRRCCRRRRNSDRSVHFGPEPNPNGIEEIPNDEPAEENENLEHPIEEVQDPEHPIEEGQDPEHPIEESQDPNPPTEKKEKKKKQKQ